MAEIMDILSKKLAEEKLQRIEGECSSILSSDNENNNDEVSKNSNDESEEILDLDQITKIEHQFAIEKRGRTAYEDIIINGQRRQMSYLKKMNLTGNKSMI